MVPLVERLKLIPDESADCCVAMIPGWESVGRRSSPAKYVARVVEVFVEVRRVLRSHGTCWVVLGDCCLIGDGKPLMASQKYHDLIGLPWRVATALREDGWHLWQEIIWHGAEASYTLASGHKRAHQTVFHLSKTDTFHHDLSQVKHYPDTSWPVTRRSMIGGCSRIGCPIGGVVLDPFELDDVKVVAEDLGRSVVRPRDVREI